MWHDDPCIHKTYDVYTICTYIYLQGLCACASYIPNSTQQRHLSKELSALQGFLFACELHLPIHLSIVWEGHTWMRAKNWFAVQIFRSHFSFDGTSGRRTCVRERKQKHSTADHDFKKCLQGTTFFFTKVFFGLFNSDPRRYAGGLYRHKASWPIRQNNNPESESRSYLRKGLY